MTTTDSTGLDSQQNVKGGMIRLTRRAGGGRRIVVWIRPASINSIYPSDQPKGGCRLFLVDGGDIDVTEDIDCLLSLLAQAQPLDPSLLSLFLHNLARPEHPQPSPAVQHG